MSPHIAPAPVATPQAPWHMWGSSQRIEVNAPAGSGPGTILFPQVYQQFRVNYKRPETWSLWFGGTLEGGNVTDVDIQVIVEWNLLLGVGRTLFDTQGTFGTSPQLVFFRWLVLAGNVPGSPPVKKWTTEVESPTLDDVVGPTTRRPLRWVPAQDLQCQARAALVITALTAVDQRVVLNIGAWCSPRTHVRPDWYSEPRTPQERVAIRKVQFVGNEFGGT